MPNIIKPRTPNAAAAGEFIEIPIDLSIVMGNYFNLILASMQVEGRLRLVTWDAVHKVFFTALRTNTNSVIEQLLVGVDSVGRATVPTVTSNPSGAPGAAISGMVSIFGTHYSKSRTVVTNALQEIITQNAAADFWKHISRRDVLTSWSMYARPLLTFSPLASTDAEAREWALPVHTAGSRHLAEFITAIDSATKWSIGLLKYHVNIPGTNHPSVERPWGTISQLHEQAVEIMALYALADLQAAIFKARIQLPKAKKCLELLEFEKASDLSKCRSYVESLAEVAALPLWPPLADIAGWLAGATAVTDSGEVPVYWIPVTKGSVEKVDVISTLTTFPTGPRLQLGSRKVRSLEGWKAGAAQADAAGPEMHKRFRIFVVTHGVQNRDVAVWGPNNRTWQIPQNVMRATRAFGNIAQLQSHGTSLGWVSDSSMEGKLKFNVDAAEVAFTNGDQYTKHPMHGIIGVTPFMPITHPIYTDGIEFVSMHWDNAGPLVTRPWDGADTSHCSWPLGAVPSTSAATKIAAAASSADRLRTREWVTTLSIQMRIDRVSTPSYIERHYVHASGWMGEEQSVEHITAALGTPGAPNAGAEGWFRADKQAANYPSYPAYGALGHELMFDLIQHFSPARFLRAEALLTAPPGSAGVAKLYPALYVSDLSFFAFWQGSVAVYVDGKATLGSPDIQVPFESFPYFGPGYDMLVAELTGQDPGSLAALPNPTYTPAFPGKMSTIDSDGEFFYRPGDDKVFFGYRMNFASSIPQYYIRYAKRDKGLKINGVITFRGGVTHSDTNEFEASTYTLPRVEQIQNLLTAEV